MMALLRYSVEEALTSLRRGWRASAFALITTTAAVFVAATAVLVSVNLREVFARLGTASELTVYLKQGVSESERNRVERVVADSPGVASHQFVSSAEALRRFTVDVPELGALSTSLGENPFPPAFEVRLTPGPEGDAAAKALAQALTKTGSVEDVRYDRQVIDRLLTGLTVTERVGALLAAVLALAAVLTITSVLRLSYLTRHSEIGIMYLVGAPPRAIRGPFVAEGMIQALLGAGLAIAILAAAFSTFRAHYGQIVADAFSLTEVQFLSPLWIIGLLVLSALVGGGAGLAAAWRER
jgi:cell division transport system permease protein